MATPDWTRPSLKPRLRRAVPIIASLSCGLAFAIGMTVGSQSSSRVLVPIVAPVQVTIAPAPAPVVVMQPAPTPAPPVPPPPQPHVTTPNIAAHARCLALAEGAPADAACVWEDGFPAVSADGALVATKYMSADPSGGGISGQSIHFIDVKTGRVVRDELVVLWNEYTTEPTALATLRVKILERADEIQRTLDARKFHTMLALGDTTFALGDNSLDQDEVHTDATKIHADFNGDLIHIVDPATATVIGRQKFGVPSPHKPDDMDSPCTNWEMRRLAVWWDPATKVTLGISEYKRGGCLCSDEVIEEVHRMR
jgi:hypothetical protein